MQVEPPEYISEPKLPVDASRYDRNQGAEQARGDVPSTEVLPTGADAAEDATVQVDRGDALKALAKLDAQLQAQEGGESGVLGRAEPLPGLKTDDEEIVETSE